MDKFRVYIPKAVHRYVPVAIREVVLASGGTTRWDAQGRWISPAGVMVSESLIVYEFNGGADVVPALHKLVAALKNEGEDEVLVETFKVEVWGDSHG